MKNKPKISPKKNPGKTQQIKNTLLTGAGANSGQDRGAQQSASRHSSNPCFNSNFLARYQEYTRWYETSWEAKKIIEIPVQDAMRVPVELKGIDEVDTKTIWRAYDTLGIEHQLKRALIQERLLGGAVLLGIFNRPQDDETKSVLNIADIQKGDFLALNVVDVTKLSCPDFGFVIDPFSPDYDKIDFILIDGILVHQSRLAIMDGDALFSRASQNVIQGFRLNPCGFGESKLAPLYDALVRATGPQQGTYHLVNMASCLILTVDHLREMTAMGGNENLSVRKLEGIAEQISLYRAAILDAQGAQVGQYSATFGALPELIMSYLQILSAGSDIPATRFLGQAPGGLNATGESDLENYYNSIASWQRFHLKPVQQKIFDWLGASIWGGEAWIEKSLNLELEYPALWNLDDVQKSTVDNTYATMITSLYEAGIISKEAAAKELLEHNILKSSSDFNDFIPGTF